MVITESIQKAIQSAISKNGSLYSFSRSIGVSHTTVSYWLSGRTRKINATLWQNLLPLISEFLNPSESLPYSYAPVASGNSSCVLREHSPGWYGTAPSQKSLAPLLRLSDLTGFDPQIDSIDELIRERSKSAAVFTSPVLPGYFAIEVEKGMSGFFPEGTRLLLRWTDSPCDGDTVLVNLCENNEFIFAVYSRKGDKIVFTPLQRPGKKRTIPKDEFHNVCKWIVPIREAIQLF